MVTCLGKSIKYWCLAMLLAAPGLAATPDEEALAQAYVAAINRKDAAALKALWHSASLACIDDRSKSFFNRYLQQEFRHLIPGDFEWRVKKLEAGFVFPFSGSGGFTVPAAPTHELRLDYKPSAQREVTRMRYLLKENGLFKQVIPCPTADTLNRMAPPP